MRSDRKITEKRIVYLLFWLCWVVYFISYVGRLNYSSAMSSMIADGVLNRSQGGVISMTFFFCYGGSQIISGILADRVNPRRMIVVGLSIAAICNFAMGCLNNMAAMAVCWGLCGFSQSMIWPAILRIFSEYLMTRTRVKLCVNLSTTIAIGTLTSYLLSAILLRFATWRVAFWIPALLMGIVVVAWLRLFPRVERFADEYGMEEPNEAPLAKPKEGVSVSPSWLLFGSGLFVLIFPTLVHGVLKDGVTAWVPTYISEAFQISPDVAVLATTMLPIVNLGGAYAANFLNNRLKNEVLTVFVLFLFATAALVALWQFGAVSLLFSVFLLALITSSMMGINTLLVSLIPMRFRGMGLVSTVSGLLNATAYLGSAISTFTIGVLVESRGWPFTIASWMVLSAIACVICLVVRNVLEKRVFSGMQGQS
ncbi:MFS transporter [Ruminococcaceae bacterium OttesenSCG-928-L11]|nr:MFS transporter [Ruminococcaceae bacterium OttesenSCG-928-L11]